MKNEGRRTTGGRQQCRRGVILFCVFPEMIVLRKSVDGVGGWWEMVTSTGLVRTGAIPWGVLFISSKLGKSDLDATDGVRTQIIGLMTSKVRKCVSGFMPSDTA
jgi:hypothetical protein